MRTGHLGTKSIIDAFLGVPRIEFVIDEYKKDAQKDIALPIGFGQTISQPKTVAIMLALLSPQKGQKILDVGSGSGWTTALLSHIVGNSGKVFALDVIEEILEFGKKNVEKFSFVEKRIAEFHLANGWNGFEEEAPYDRILVSAGAESVPEALLDQLKIGGKMVIPIGRSLWFIEKKSEDEFYKKELPDFIFVPLVKSRAVGG